MRVVKKIPHERFLIEVHQYNQKYLLNITLDHYVQTFKVSDELVENLDVFENLVNSEFLQSCLKRFVSMRTDFLNEFNKYKNE
jgi:hypothetical protein